MTATCTMRNNGIAYLFWSWVLRNNGWFTAWLDSFYFGSSRGMNDYDSLASNYKGSNVKPDKQYSILPTVISMLGNVGGKVVVDVGCGSGFFTVPLADNGAGYVVGVDNSQAQIELAKKHAAQPRISYVVSDVFTERTSRADIFVVPFVANYARTKPILQHLFQSLFDQLPQGGKAVFVIDLPNGKSLKRFGAVKTLQGEAVDETRIKIELFNELKKICALWAVYFTPQTVEKLLLEVGFKTVTWHKPIVSQEGLETMGAEFWNGYLEDPELGYLCAEK